MNIEYWKWTGYSEKEKFELWAHEFDGVKDVWWCLGLQGFNPKTQTYKFYSIKKTAWGNIRNYNPGQDMYIHGRPYSGPAWEGSGNLWKKITKEDVFLILL